MKQDCEAPASLKTRLGWLILIWAISVGSLGVLAWAMKLVMNAVGLTASP